jgi:excinuclease ABC subunit C
LFHIEKCSGPCVGEVDAEKYASMVEDLCSFLDGETDDIVRRMKVEMEEASKALEFERAARMRDRLAAVSKAVEKQQIVGERSEDIDVIGVAQDELEAAVQVFFVRKGRIVGRKGFVMDKVEQLENETLMNRLVEGLYGEEPPLGVPKMILVPVQPSSSQVLEDWLSAERGSRVEIRVPVRGDKRELMEMVDRNAKEDFHRHRLKRSSDHNSRSRALSELQDLLGLPEAPLRIECYDMAHLQGTDYVGSMVVLEDGLPAKREYRRFRVKEVPGNDDFAAMEEVLTRRLKAYLEERDGVLADETTNERARARKFAYPPQLLLVDGGKGQLAVAERVVRSLGLESEIPVASLAKRFEEVFVPGRSEPVDVPRGSEALFMLQRIRDEAHRFANTFHREVRGKRMVASALDDIDGLGEARKKKLIKAFGGVNAVKKATLEELTALSWLPEAVARNVFEKFHPLG